MMPSQCRTRLPATFVTGTMDEGQRAGRLCSLIAFASVCRLAKPLFMPQWQHTHQRCSERRKFSLLLLCFWSLSDGMARWHTDNAPHELQSALSNVEDQRAGFWPSTDAESGSEAPG